MTVDHISAWPRLIVKMVQAKSRLNEVDGGFWPYNLPAVAATEGEVSRVEAEIGSLPRDYRSFLKHANGWRGLFQEVDMLSCSQLIESEHLRMFRSMYEGTLTEEEWRGIGLSHNSLIPIGVSLRDRDVFVIDKRRSTSEAASVVWLAGEVIDQWSDFISFFESMIEYNRREILRFGK